jgi:hypothetical protein
MVYCRSNTLASPFGQSKGNFDGIQVVFADTIELTHPHPGEREDLLAETLFPGNVHSPDKHYRQDHRPRSAAHPLACDSPNRNYSKPEPKSADLRLTLDSRRSAALLSQSAPER